MRPVGWRYESHRHMLAAKGIRTKSGFQGRVGQTAIVAEKLKPGYVYPVTLDEVRRVLSQTPESQRKGLKAVVFAQPKDKYQSSAWAQMVRSKKKVLIFAQPEHEVVGNPELKKHMKEYVLPHELAHHRVLNVEKKTDKELSTAEARADAGAFGFDPIKDKDAIRHFKRYHE